MPETEINTVVARLVDEVTPAAQKMRDTFSGIMDDVTGEVLNFENVFRGIDSYVPDFGATVTGFQEMLSSAVTFEGAMATLKDMATETGNAYVEMGLQTIDTLTEILENSEEILGSVGDYFNQFKEDAIAGATGFASSVREIGAQLVAQARQQVEAQRKADIEKVKNSTMSEEEKARAIAEIDKKAEAEKKKMALVEKGMAITKAVINAALAVSSALTTTPFPLGIAMAAVAAGMGAAQVAAISAQTFAEGGVVPGASYTGDMVAARVNSGEMILNREQQARLFAIADGSGIGGGGTSISVGGDTIIINGSVDEDTIEQIRQTRTEQIEYMRELLREMQYHGQLEI